MKMSGRFYLTLSKLMAYIMLFAGLLISMYIKDPYAFTFSLPFVTALVLGKQGQKVLLAKYQNETDTVYNYHSADGRDSDSEVVSKGSDLS